MTSPREQELGVLAPLAPNFPRKINSASATLEKFSGVEDLYDDIVRQPTANATASAGIKLSMDVPSTVRRARFTLENTVVTLTAANDYGSVKICDLPDRNILILAAELVATVKFGGDYADNDDPVVGVGTAAASANPIATTAVNVIAASTQTNIVVATANSLALSFLGSLGDAANLLVADGANNALYLNVSSPDTQLAADGTATFNGTFDVWYIDLGNVGS